ncbi:sugar ABC transporter ATP-binding protein [Gordonia sp. NPDC058843]|uniref:sugar ABC transporter ATP-binding protein n=1 Tax=Gordonia sp. NPDC058843 TaxID=3346648 RepID=UPI0036D173CC
MSDKAELLSISEVSKHYTGVAALTDATLTINEGEVRALLGRNGAGKSTLIRILSGVERADSGRITIDGSELQPGSVRAASHLGVETVYQELSLVPELTVAENLFIGSWPTRGLGSVDHDLMRRETVAVLDRLGIDIDPDARVSGLSLAAQQLVEICRAVRRNPRVLILDEPTSALAAAEVSVVLDAVQKISDTGVAVVYVSHRLDEIRRIAHSATVMRDGHVIDTVEMAGTKTSTLVTMMVGAEFRAAERPSLRVVDRTSPPVLSVKGLTVPPKIEAVDFDLFRGEVLGIAGLMGAGKTELLRAVAGFDKRTHGSVSLDGNEVPASRPRTMKKLGVGITPEDRKNDAIVPMMGVDENIVLSDFGKVRSGITLLPDRIRDRAVPIIDRLSIATATPKTPIVNLSGGNQQKAVVGRWLHADARVLLLDEPTRGVDVEAKAGIYQLARELADDGKSVIFVSGELEELPLVCDRVICLHGGRVSAEFTGEEITVDAILSAAMAAEA